jgi:multiple sugar transport system permease protein
MSWAALQRRGIVRRSGSRSVPTGLVAAAFILPSFLPMLLFTIGPMAASMVLSFYKWDLLRPARWVGIDNYQSLAADPEFHAAIGHTLFFIAGYMPLVFVGGLAIALALNQQLRGGGLFRTIYFLPVVTSWVVVAFIWKWLLNPQTGVVNYVLGLAGIHGPGWWTDPNWAMPSIILASAWKDLGFVMVILLAGLKAIPDEYYDAARVDGAGAWARFWYITLPLLSPAVFFVVVISLINGFQVFDQVWVMTAGGPAGASTVVVQDIVTHAFRYGQVGYASAMSWILFAAILGVTLVQLGSQKRWVIYS